MSEHSTPAPAPDSASPKLRARESALLAAWACVVLAQLATHVLWLDEAQAWNLVAGADSAAELLRRLGYEGHPGLWYALLFVVTRVTSSPLALQAIAASCALAGAFVFVRRAPFAFAEKGLVLFGLFVVSEYATFARNYGLGMVLLFASAAALADRKRPRAWGLWLGLLANTSFYGGLAAGVLVVDRLWARTDTRAHVVRQFVWLAAAGVLALAVMTPSGEVNVASRASRELVVFAWLGQLVGIAHGLVAPIPPIGPHFWALVAPLPALFVLTWLAALVFALARPWRRAALFAALFLGVTLFGYYVYGVYVRHVGTLWLLAVALVWLTRSETADAAARDTPLARAQRVAFWAVCGTHVVASLVAVPQHLSRPLTRANDVADYIATHVDARVPLVVEDDRAGVAVSAYLGGRALFQLSRLEPSTYVIWDQARQIVPPGFIVQNGAVLHEEHKDALLLLAADHGPRLDLGGATLLRAAVFDGAVVPAESVWIYVFADGALAHLARSP